VAAVTREVGEIDPTLPFVAFRSMDDRIASSATR
jgi:hypothetical protein